MSHIDSQLPSHEEMGYSRFPRYPWRIRLYISIHYLSDEQVSPILPFHATIRHGIINVPFPKFRFERIQVYDFTLKVFHEEVFHYSG